jgi:hypothetical protein
MFSIHQNKILHVFKYDLSSLFIERDRKAMQKVLKKEKNVGHMKVPKYRKKRGHNEGLWSIQKKEMST